MKSTQQNDDTLDQEIELSEENEDNYEKPHVPEIAKNVSKY